VNYREAVRYLLSFADFERSGRFQDRPDVSPMLLLLHELGDPHLGRRTVHVAGSKGKGSISAMVESILREAGYWTGLYTSPHLHSYRERVRINGDPLSPDGFVRLTSAVKRGVAHARPKLGKRSFVTFDLLTALGFMAFREAGVQIQVVEVGLGGRLDSTNVFEEKDLAVITPISLEHTQILGDTIEAVAREKCGIVTPGCTVIMAPQQHEDAERVMRAAAAAAAADLIDVSRDYEWRTTKHDLKRQEIRVQHEGEPVLARLPLLGANQVENAATAVACVHALRRRGAHIPEESIRDGLACVRWPGRAEVLTETPLLIVDGAHNRDSARRFRETLAEYFSAERAFFIVGASVDKDIVGLAEELAPVAQNVFAVRADHPRAMEPARIAEAFAALGVPAEVRDSVGAAIDEAMADNSGGGVICVVGSLFVAAAAREHLGRAEREPI
jgi:dihydrofolate synthase/folylpolyglutamate synthase